MLSPPPVPAPSLALSPLDKPLIAFQWRRPLVALALLLAFAFRIASLDAYGFSEDEVAKLVAIEEYRRGNFSANAEHPMLMKMAIWASLSAADVWNQLRPSAPISAESALRLPNVLAGTATVGAVYGAISLLSGAAIGLTAALIVALDPNITAINRLGKEDTFLMFFFMAAVYCYEKAKQIGAWNPAAAQPHYTASGAMFGLMLASKYMPHFFGVYALFNVAAQRDAGANKPRKSTYYGALAMAFVIANAAIVLPSTWAYARAYMAGESTIHHGYFYDGQLYTNSGLQMLYGVPVTYYLRLMATKIPLAVLVCAVVGLVPLILRRRERGFVWMRVCLIAPLLGYSLMASKFQRYAMPALLFVDVIAAAGFVTVLEWFWDRPWSETARRRVCAAAGLAFASMLAVGQWGSAPFYSIHQNVMAAAAAPPASVFPEESYDYGVREAVREIAARAAPQATVASDATLVVQHYVNQTGRRDLVVSSLSRDGLAGTGERWVLVQDAHIYFENQSLIEQVRMHRPWREYRLGGTVVLQVYRLGS
jgi:4-amino-4-deoxy-L-arabinose transferase-like glycosyltransferase